MKHHVHVYQVVTKAEIEVDIETEKEAMNIALKKVENSNIRFVKSDCKYLAMIPTTKGSDKKTLDLVGKPFAEWQKTAILETLKLTRGRRDKAARMLKIPVRTFYRRLREFGIRKWPDSIPREARDRGLPW